MPTTYSLAEHDDGRWYLAHSARPVPQPPRRLLAGRGELLHRARMPYVRAMPAASCRALAEPKG